MQVSLKKAAALASSLNAIVTPVPGALSINVHSDAAKSPALIEAAYGAAVLERDATLDKARNVVRSVYIIRSLIGKANEGDINAFLTERASIDKELTLLNSIPVVTKTPDFVAVSRQLEDMLSGPQVGTAVYRPPANSGSLPLFFDPKAEVSALKKRRIAVEDRLAQLNFNLNIQLPDDVVVLLRDNDLI